MEQLSSLRWNDCPVCGGTGVQFAWNTHLDNTIPVPEQNGAVGLRIDGVAGGIGAARFQRVTYELGAP